MEKMEDVQYVKVEMCTSCKTASAQFAVEYKYRYGSKKWFRLSMLKKQYCQRCYTKHGNGLYQDLVDGQVFFTKQDRIFWCRYSPCGQKRIVSKKQMKLERYYYAKLILQDQFVQVLKKWIVKCVSTAHFEALGILPEIVDQIVSFI
jgi:hypothetical protein